MYGKLFASMYDGTLYGNWKALVTFQQMIVLADRAGIVDMTPQAIAARTSIPLKLIQEGLSVLEAPDEYSRSPDANGRRIERLDPSRPWGWQIVNYLHYRELASADDKRAKERERIAGKRAREKQQAPTGSNMLEVVGDVGHADADADADADVSLPSGERGANAPRPRRKSSKTVPEDWTPSEWLLKRIAEEEVPACLIRGGTTVEMELERFRNCTFGTARSDWDKTAWNWLLTECKKINQHEVRYGTNRQARR